MSGVLISTSVIWFCGRRQKPCCCALHFINHCFMWTRSAPPHPPPPPSSGPSRPLRHVYPAARGLSGPERLTSNYFGLFSFAGGQPGIPTERERERDDFLTNSVACEGTGPRVFTELAPPHFVFFFFLFFCFCLFLSLTSLCSDSLATAHHVTNPRFSDFLPQNNSLL